MKLSALNSLLVVRAGRGARRLPRGPPPKKAKQKLYSDDNKCVMFKTETLKNSKLEASIDIRLLRFSHETFGAPFLIGPTRGEGGQVAFLRTSPK